MSKDLIDYPILINKGGTGKSVRSFAFDNLAPQEPEIGDTIVWDGEHWVLSSEQSIQELITLQEELADNINDLQNTLLDVLKELRKIKYGITDIVQKELVEI